LQSDAEEDADFMEHFSFAMDGAALSGGDSFYCTNFFSVSFICSLVTCVTCSTVVWTLMHDDKDMSKYAGEELELAVKEVQGNHMEKWEAINMLKYVLSSIHYPWIIKSHSLNLMLILSGEDHVEEINNHVDFTCFAHRIFETLKVSLFVFIKNVVIFVFYCINILVTFIGH
jgi:glomulin